MFEQDKCCQFTEANTPTILIITSYYTSYIDTGTDIGNEFVSEPLGLGLEGLTVDT